MKRILFIITIVLLVFSACEKKKQYSNEQKNALNKLDGNYHAYKGKEMIYAVISFTSSYRMPIPVYEGKKVLFYKHGECFFSDYSYYIPEKGYITCYYSLSENADVISFYYKDGENDKRLLREYGLHIENNDVFTLNDNGRILKFEKVK